MERISSSLATPGSRAFRPLDRLVALMALGRSRHRLGQLDDHLLRDIRLTRSEARQEADKTDWNARSHWLR